MLPWWEGYFMDLMLCRAQLSHYGCGASTLVVCGHIMQWFAQWKQYRAGDRHYTMSLLQDFSVTLESSWSDGCPVCQSLHIIRVQIPTWIDWCCSVWCNGRCSCNFRGETNLMQIVQQLGSSIEDTLIDFHLFTNKFSFKSSINNERKTRQTLSIHFLFHTVTSSSFIHHFRHSITAFNSKCSLKNCWNLRLPQKPQSGPVAYEVNGIFSSLSPT